MTKMTYTTAIETVASYLMTAELPEDVAVAIDRLGELREQISKRNTKTAGKPTKTQRENAEVKDRIRECLSHTLEGMKCGEVAAEVGISGQKCSALLSQMIKAGEVTKREEKRVSLFLLPENDCSVVEE